MERLFRQQAELDAQEAWKSQREIRKMLHPTLAEEYLPPPGVSKQPATLRGSQSVSSLLSSQSKKGTIDCTPSKSIFSRYKEFKKMPQFSYEVPIIRNASPYIGSEEEVMRKSEFENKRHWVSEKNFKTFFGQASSLKAWQQVPNYVTRDPSGPPMLHKFREEDRRKWLGAAFNTRS